MKKNLSIAALGSVLMIIVMRFQGSSLKTPVSTRSIIDLEFADTSQRVYELLSRWDISMVKMNIWLDFIFIICYVLFLSLAAEACALQWPENSMPKQAGLFLARIAYAAGIFDVVENLFMLQTVEKNFTDLSLQLTFYCAAIKFMLIAFILIYFIVSLPLVIKNKS
jgi:hypothetical protein